MKYYNAEDYEVNRYKEAVLKYQVMHQISYDCECSMGF